MARGATPLFHRPCASITSKTCTGHRHGAPTVLQVWSIERSHQVTPVHQIIVFQREFRLLHYIRLKLQQHNASFFHVVFGPVDSSQTRQSRPRDLSRIQTGPTHKHCNEAAVLGV